jgi:hypothetical protein
MGRTAPRQRQRQRIGRLNTTVTPASPRSPLRIIGEHDASTIPVLQCSAVIRTFVRPRRHSVSLPAGADEEAAAVLDPQSNLANLLRLGERPALLRLLCERKGFDRRRERQADVTLLAASGSVTLPSLTRQIPDHRPSATATTSCPSRCSRLMSVVEGESKAVGHRAIDEAGVVDRIPEGDAMRSM